MARVLRRVGVRIRDAIVEVDIWRLVELSAMGIWKLCGSRRDLGCSGFGLLLLGTLLEG